MPLSQPPPCAAPALAQQAAELAQAPVFKAELHVLLETYDEGDIVFNEIFQPLRSYELPVGQQCLDGRRPEQAQIAPHQRDALRRGGGAPMLQQRPQHRNTEPAGHYGQDQDVHVRLAQLPVAPVQRQQLRALEVQKAQDQPCRQISVQTDMLEEALQAAIFRGVQCRAGELARQMRQVHRPTVRQPHEQNRQRLQTRLAQIKMRA
jgi:hypothetical protein